MYDIIGDVHGCIDELHELVELLGYEYFCGGLLEEGVHDEDQVWRFWFHPNNRKIIFAGDLNDRGPSSAGVYDLVMELVAQGVALMVQGNHDNKLMRWLKADIDGTEWKGNIGHGLSKTIEEFNERGDHFKNKVYNFLLNTPYKFENDALIVVHAAYKEDQSAKVEKETALYGVVDRKAGLSPEGFPNRVMDWKSEYKGTKTIVFGHIVHDEARFQAGITGVKSASDRVFETENGAKIIAVDWGVPHGGELAAYNFPEDTFTTVKAKRVYW